MNIQFLGATCEVTGSCYLLHCGGRRILVECGLVQGSQQDEMRNTEPFPFDPTQIDAVVLTHSHLDHSGRIPLLIKSGFKGPVYTHEASRDLCRIMFKDAGYINEKEAEWENRKRERKHKPLLEPLYTVQDAQDAMHRFKPMVYGEKNEILPGITIRLRDAGHILGSSIVECWLHEGGESRKLVFSGDLGHQGAAILRDPEIVKQADLVVMESTYGDRLHRSWEETWEEMAQIFIQARKGHGNILIPAFTVGRTQELLYTFARYYEDWKLGNWQVFLDSPMAIAATDVYARYSDLYDKEATKHAHEQGGLFALPNLTLSRTALQSMGINQISDGAIIIAGSGMCSGGRIKHHLKHNIWRNDCQLVIVGFQARGTLGRALVDGTDTIRLWGESIRVAAKIHTIGGLSAHADSDGLINWYSHFEGNPLVALVHGEAEAMDALGERLISENHARLMTPALGEQLDLLAL